MCVKLQLYKKSRARRRRFSKNEPLCRCSYSGGYKLPVRILMDEEQGSVSHLDHFKWMQKYAHQTSVTQSLNSAASFPHSQKKNCPPSKKSSMKSVLYCKQQTHFSFWLTARQPSWPASHSLNLSAACIYQITHIMNIFLPLSKIFNLI